MVRNLAPVVTVEEVGGRGVIATFSRDARDEDRRIREERTRYLAIWEVEDSHVRPGFVYRIRVSVNGVELGFAEAVVARTRAEVSAAARRQYVPLGGDDLPIAFRIEPAALLTARATVGPEGGRVCTPKGACVVIPGSALDELTAIQVDETSLPPPAGVGATSPVYRLQPEGLVFARPVSIVLPLPDGVTSGSVYWTRPGSQTEFDAVGGAIVGRTIVAENVHFSLAVVGIPSDERTVTGGGFVTWISASQRISVPMDFSQPGLAPEALVDDGAGNLMGIPGVAGTGAALGTFTIPGVPVGEYILHAGSQYLVTSTNAPDLGWANGGRPDFVTPAAGSSVDLAVTGMEPWEAGDSLELFSSEAGQWYFGLEYAGAGVSAGAADFRDTVDLSYSNGGALSLIQGTSRGDRAYVAQLTNRVTSSGFAYQAMTRVAALSPFEMVQGGTVPAGGSFATVVPDLSLDLDVRTTELHAILADANPNASRACLATGCCSIGVYAQPGLASDGFYSSNADPLGANVGSTGVRTGPMLYPSPAAAGLDGSWGLMGGVRCRVGRAYALPGFLPASRSGFNGLDWTMDPAAFPSVIRPPVSLPTAITVSGIDFFAGGPGIGTIPAIAWNAPTTGTPSYYSLSVWELTGVGARTRIATVANLVTPNTRVTLPPGILQAGHTYAFLLSAILTTPTAANAPYRLALERASASVSSEPFTP